jgi:hypothetical protein
MISASTASSALASEVDEEANNGEVMEDGNIDVTEDGHDNDDNLLKSKEKKPEANFLFFEIAVSIAAVARHAAMRARRRMVTVNFPRLQFTVMP